MDLSKYWGKRIRVTFTDGQVLDGYVKSYTSRVNSDINLEELTIETDSNPYVEFNESEVKGIEIVE